MHQVGKCECDIPEGGFCKRHQCRKTAHWVMLCRTKPTYRKAWEEGRGPGQRRRPEPMPPPPPESALPAAQEPRTSGCGGCGQKSPPSLVRQAWNLATALAAFVADELRTVSEEQYAQRLRICDPCDQRRENRCLKCGCRLTLKARGRAFRCPLGKWPNLTSSENYPQE